MSRIGDDIDDKLAATHLALVQAAQPLSGALTGDPVRLEQYLENRPGLRSLFDGMMVIGVDGRPLVVSPRREVGEMRYQEASCSYRQLMAGTRCWRRSAVCRSVVNDRFRAVLSDRRGPAPDPSQSLARPP